MYGPTESTTFATSYLVDEVREGRTVPIGRPIANTRAWVVDRLLRPVPLGTPGELVLGGDGLARGYFGRPDLTAERFVPSPFEPGARVYLTGDRVRRRSSDRLGGALEFLERTDAQVKIRGFRVEPGEIESALRKVEGVREAVVVAQEGTGGRRLAAFVVGVSSPELKDTLRQILPEWMIPASITVLDTLPRTPSGKIDRRALSLLETLPLAPPQDAATSEAPRTPVEEAVAAGWTEVLRLDQVGLEDNFFDLGGHSLLAGRVLSRLRSSLGVELTLTDFFRSPTVAGLARRVEEMQGIARDRPMAAPASAPREGALSESADHLPLVAVRPATAGSRPPLFFVHPANGQASAYLALARHLTPDLPLYALQSPGLTGGSLYAGMEALGSAYLDAVRSVQPRGPYRLGGWCVGGTFAYELARRLRALGEEIEILVLVDSHAPEPEHFAPQDEAVLLASFAREIAGAAGKSLDLPLDELRRIPSEARLAWVIETARKLEILPASFSTEQARWSWDVFRSNLRAVEAYRPERQPLRAVLFRATRQIHDVEGKPSLGWARWITGRLDVVAVEGDHSDAIREPAVEIVAREISERLAPAPAAAAAS
jgi:thioesterase domain-containing protein